MTIDVGRLRLTRGEGSTWACSPRADPDGNRVELSQRPDLVGWPGASVWRTPVVCVSACG